MKRKLLVVSCAAVVLLLAGMVAEAFAFGAANASIQTPTRAYKGGSVTLNTSGLWLSAEPDQHEAALTMFGNGYGPNGTGADQWYYAITLMRGTNGWFGTLPDGQLHMYTLASMGCYADPNRGTHVAVDLDHDGQADVFDPNTDYSLRVVSAGDTCRVWVYNQDGLATPTVAWNAELQEYVPRYADWPDVSDSQGSTAGHWAYRWDAYLNGTKIGEGWMDSTTATVKFETSKRIDPNVFYATTSWTQYKDARLYTTATSSIPWSSSIGYTDAGNTGNNARWFFTTPYVHTYCRIGAY